mgnify:FL=1
MSLNYLPHPEFYFDDASLAIQVGQTLFKVHASILARHSEVFRDMVQIAGKNGNTTGSSGEEVNRTVDGIPVVELHDDEKEFEDTLKAIYDSLCVPSFVPVSSHSHMALIQPL